MAVEDYLGKPFHGVSSRPCWLFCQTVRGEMGLPIPPSLDKMHRIDEPQIGVLVLFQTEEFHAGVVWPTTVHFVHCRRPLNEPDKPPICRKDSLNDPLYRDIIDGFYQYRE